MVHGRHTHLSGGKECWSTGGSCDCYLASLDPKRTMPRASNLSEGPSYQGDIRTRRFKSVFLKAMTSFAEINIDILNIDAMVKRLGMSGKAYWIQHNFSETM